MTRMGVRKPRFVKEKENAFPCGLQMAGNSQREDLVKMRPW